MNIIKLLNAVEVFVQFNQTKLSPKLAYKIMKFCKSVEVEEDFYNSRKNEIINTYAEKDEFDNPIINSNGIVRIVADKMLDAKTAMDELNRTEVETPNIKFTLDELEGLELSVSDMYALDAFIEE